MKVEVNPNGFDEVPVELLRRAVGRALQGSGSDAEVSLTLVSDDEITALNRKYLEKDHTTDVLAFSMGDDAPLGDVYVCVHQAERQAHELGVPMDEELARLAIHGTLHVLGQDHPEGPERVASPMFVLQEQLLGEVLEPEY